MENTCRWVRAIRNARQGRRRVAILNVEERGDLVRKVSPSPEDGEVSLARVGGGISAEAPGSAEASGRTIGDRQGEQCVCGGVGLRKQQDVKLGQWERTLDPTWPSGQLQVLGLWL